MFAGDNKFSTVAPAPTMEAARISGVSSSSLRSPARPGISGATVLVTDEHYKHSLGIVRQLGRLGAHVSVVAASKESLACRSRFCKEVILSDGHTVEALVETTLRAVSERRFDLVMPVSYPMTLALARRRDDLAAYTHLEVMGSEAIEQAADKAKMTQLAGRIGIPAPKTFLLTEVQGRLQELSFPVVIKLQKESPGRLPIRYVHNLTELKGILSAELGDKSPGQGAKLLVQEFIPGYGCGFFATYQYGVCKRVFMHRRVREFPAAGGVSSCAESFYDLKLETYGRRMLDALGWHGVAMVEFRRDARDADYKLMEINPKFWGSLDLALAAGADFPGDLCRMALGWDLSFTDSYERKLRFQWPFSGYGEIFHVRSRPHSVLQVALDFLNPAVKSNIWMSDFRPNLEELRALARQILHKRKG